MTPSHSPDLGALIARLESATGPDRDVDAAIYVSVFKGAYEDETPEATHTVRIRR